jgi:hypothetical protein
VVKLQDDPLYSVKGGAVLLGISHWTLWDHLKCGRIKRTKVGGRTMIRESELLKLVRDESATEAAERNIARERKSQAAATAKR